MKSRSLNRRLFLGGTGAALIGLPLLEELVPERAHAQAGGVPRRVLTLSFGLGIEKALQEEGAMGPLQPLLKFAGKAAFFSNLTNAHLAGSGTVHFRVGATQFTGRKQDGYNAGGPSIEQIVKNHLHPGGVPTVTGVPSVTAGLWSRTGAVSQYTRQWNQDGSPGPRPERRPSKVFQSIFEKYQSSPQQPMASDGEPAAADPQALLEAHVQRSVLDTVKDQHSTLTGNRSFLGKASKARIDNHLTEIRQVEKQLVIGDRLAAKMEAAECGVPNSTDFADPDGVTFYDAPSGPTGGPEINYGVAQTAFRLSGKLIALGITCDALRFGSMVFYGAGGHMRFRGTYEATAIGASLDFDDVDNSPHNAIFHQYVKDSIRAYQHFAISQLAYVLEELDAVTEPNGKTALDNTLTVIGTEYGRNHDDDGQIFHAVLGGEGKFAPGQYDGNHGFDDLYGTLMKGYDIPDSGIGGEEIPGLLA